MSRYLEDLPIGEVADLGFHTFTAEEIKTFALAYDPQPFHIDETAARASHFARAVRLRLAHRRRVDEADA